MTDTPDTAVPNRIEGQAVDFNPEKNPVMRPVIVQTEVEPGIGIEQRGWLTDIPGAKVDLHQIAEHNRKRNEQGIKAGQYERIYFTTNSGTIYVARNLDDGAWEIEASTRDGTKHIKAPATLKVGERFVSPHTKNEIPELNTSPVQSITLVDRSGVTRKSGIPFSQTKTAVGTQFATAVRARGGKLR